jgi:carboxymethylenebutenolidase
VCFAFDARPPELPADLVVPRMAGGAGAEVLELTSADGTAFSAALAESPEADGPAVVIFPDVRGLYRFYEELALRFAERGYAAVAIDYFGRTAGVAKRGDDFDYPPHVQQTSADGVKADTRAAVDHLRALGCTSIFTLGFCMGGRLSWLASSWGLGLKGAIGFYGRPGPFTDGQPGPTQQVADFEAPILALQAGDDANITAEHNAEFDRALTDAGVEHEVVTYDGAPHSFFDRKQEEFANASADAWARTLGFIDRYGASAG